MKKSALIIPISVIVHLAIINLTLYHFTPSTYFIYPGIVWYNLSWLLVAIGLNYYPTARNEKFNTEFYKFLQQNLIFGLAYFTVLAFLKIPFNPIYQLYILGILFFNLSIFRWCFFYLRKVYRMEGGNSLKVVVIGREANLKKIKTVFEQPEFGYRYNGYFDNNFSSSATYLGPIQNCFQYILENEIEEIFCMVSQLTKQELEELISFADNNLKKLKIIPDNKEIFTRAMNVELFGSVPVLNLRLLPLDTEIAKYQKRIFDIFFSSLVIIFVLSWLTPLLFIFIKLESKGPLFFKQRRNGYNRKEFDCYKFRSMAVNEEANFKMSTKNDRRITKLGKILRKTSIDELPQFFNVFLGNMSVVGPRPHMEAHTLEYETSVDKYLVRHFAKPGITGLAQIKGYRGEIENRSDIVNRTRLDIFYLEKWSTYLDIKIIFSTVNNAVRGEEKAY